MYILALILTSALFVPSAFATNACVMESYRDEVIDTGTSLKEIQQKELTENACKEYFSEYDRREKGKGLLSETEFNRLTVLCGKWMFLNLGMRSDIGIPLSIYNTLQRFEEVGPRFNRLGFLEDESWKEEKYPFGMVRVDQERRFAFKRVAANRVLQISCAGCHTAQLPDGRFSIGATNEKLEYGQFNIYTMFSVWLMDKKKNDPERWLPEIIEKYKDLDQKYNSLFLNFLKMVSIYPANELFIRGIVGEEPAPLLTQKTFLESEPGIYNGFAPSLNFIDKEIYLTAPQLYGIGQDAEKHYGSLAGLESLDDFVSEALVYTNRSSRYNKEKYINPFKEYLKCIEAPKTHEPLNQTSFEKGKSLFQQNCMSCHDLPNGGGSEAVSPEVINTPNSYVDLFMNYQAVDVQSKVTYNLLSDMKLNKSASEIKVRRLRGIWTRKNLTSNGQIKGLDHLFCTSKDRGDQDPKNPRSEGIHADLCNDYSPTEKESLIEYLKHF